MIGIITAALATAFSSVGGTKQLSIFLLVTSVPSTSLLSLSYVFYVCGKLDEGRKVNRQRYCIIRKKVGDC
jgi:hypothetical protein